MGQSLIPVGHAELVDALVKALELCEYANSSLTELLLEMALLEESNPKSRTPASAKIFGSK